MFNPVVKGNGLFPNRKQYKKWSLPNKWSFWAAFFGLPIAVISLFSSSFPILDRDDSLREKYQFKFQVTEELEYNIYWLVKEAEAKNKNQPIPIGMLKTKAFLKLIDNEYINISKHSYGEEKQLYQLALALNDLSAEINKNSSKSGLKSFEKRSDFNIHDVLFLNKFFLWYLRHFFGEVPVGSGLEKLWVPPPKHDVFYISEAVKPKFKYFLYEGKPILSFTDFLGLID